MDSFTCLPPDLQRRVKWLAWPATPSAQAFKDAFQQDGDYLTCRGDAMVMCSARSPACAQLPYRAFLGWHLGPNRIQTRYLGQRCCVPCCHRLGVDPQDRTLCIIDLDDSCEEDYLGSDEDDDEEGDEDDARSDASSP